MIARRLAKVEENGSFWITTNYDPIELLDFFNELGFSATTMIQSSD